MSEAAQESVAYLLRSYLDKMDELTTENVRLRDVERGAKQQIEDMEGEIERLRDEALAWEAQSQQNRGEVERLRAALQAIDDYCVAAGLGGWRHDLSVIARRALEGGKSDETS